VNSFAHSQTGGKQPSTAVVTQPKVYIQFLADQSFMAKYRTAAALLSNRLPKLTFEAVFVALIEEFIRRHEPAERHLRRERAAARGDQAVNRVPIPLCTRDAVFARDRGRCTYVGSDGKRCDATIRLHVDHIKPVARGGTNDISNLRLLCARHNRLQAERILGRDVMSGFRHRQQAAGSVQRGGSGARERTPLPHSVTGKEP
jgi:5-methylcytosine-specific restriction endonuclease McrA